MSDVLSPDGIVSVQLKKAERVVRDAIRGELVRSWDGYETAFNNRFVRGALEEGGIESHNLPGWGEIFRGILMDYVNAGWRVSYEGGFFVFRTGNGSTEIEGF